MADFAWSSWGISVTGPLHKINGIPNQDYWMARSYKWGNVVVVSDGLGSKPHSEYGSKAACLAVFDAAKSYQQNRKAKIIDVLRLIQAKWLINIAPLPPSECSATCLFAIRIKDEITLGRLGDGMIVVCGDSEKDCFILQDDKQDSFSNYTHCLTHEFTPRHWETVTINSSDCKVVVLCTDGISDDILQDQQIPFALRIYSIYGEMNSGKRKKEIKGWLNNWPVPGHTDDKTIACLLKKVVLNESNVK